MNDKKKMIAMILLVMVITGSLFVIAGRLSRSFDRTEPFSPQLALKPERANTLDELVIGSAMRKPP